MTAIAASTAHHHATARRQRVMAPRAERALTRGGPGVWLGSTIMTETSSADHRDRVETTVRSFVARRLFVSPEEVPMDGSFVDSGFDSLDHIDLLMAVEEEFGVSFTERDTQDLRTGAQLVELIIHALDGGAGRPSAN